MQSPNLIKQNYSMDSLQESLEAKRHKFEMDSKMWRAYFLNNDNKGLDFIKDMENALKAGFIDHDDATLCLMGLNAAIKELQPLIDRNRTNSVQGKVDEWRANQK